MIATSDSLALLPENDKIKLTLYISDELKNFKITGLDKLEKSVNAAYTDFNRRNQNRIEFEKSVPQESEISSIAEHYGTQIINWSEKDGKNRSGILGLVLEHGDSFRLIPVSMQRSLFGYVIAGLENLEDSLFQALQSLVSKTMEIGYVTGHGEADLNDSQTGAGMLNSLVSDIYTFRELNLAEDEIPLNIGSLLLNGPKTEFSEKELYKIDQFLMRGGNVLFFTDAFKDEASAYAYGQQPNYVPVKTGLEKLLNAYGISTGADMIMDENCFTQTQQGMGKLSLKIVSPVCNCCPIPPSLELRPLA